MNTGRPIWDTEDQPLPLDFGEVGDEENRSMSNL